MHPVCLRRTPGDASPGFIDLRLLKRLGILRIVPHRFRRPLRRAEAWAARAFMPGRGRIQHVGSETRSPTHRAGAGLFVVAILLAGCGGNAITPIVRSVEAGPRVPVVMVPGITGSVLVDEASGDTLWGKGRNLLSPRDGGYSIARPIGLPLVPEASSSPADDTGVRAPRLLDRPIRLFGGLIRKPIYGPVLGTLEVNGWTRGDLDTPTADADLYGFAYDWRGDNVVAARQLAARLDAVRRARGVEVLEVDLLCQSNGGQICRYLARYGDAPLAAAEDGTAGPLPWLRVRKIVLAGTSNGGSARILLMMHRGRRYVPVVGRFMQPEVLFTFPSLFQDLPHAIDRIFVDRRGRTLDLDLFDAATWIDHQLSAFRPDARARMAEHPEIFGTEADRRAYLERVLDRARRLHAVLRRDASDPAHPPRIYLLQNGYDPSPELVVLDTSADAPGADDPSMRLLFTGDPQLEGDPYLHYLVSAPGDGHATAASQGALSPAERDAVAAPPYLVRGGHFELILDPSLLRRMVEFLRAP